MAEIAMRENEVMETLERTDFFIAIRATSNAQKPKVMIMLADDTSTGTDVTKYQNLQQLTEARVKLGEDRRTVESDLERIYTAYASIEGVAMAGESACYRRNIAIALGRDFGWED
jgi:hypothetical protein